MKLCIDCKYHVKEIVPKRKVWTSGMWPWREDVYEPEHTEHWCTHPIINPVTGEHGSKFSCLQSRHSRCGPDGNWWEGNKKAAE